MRRSPRRRSEMTSMSSRSLNARRSRSSRCAYGLRTIRSIRAGLFSGPSVTPRTVKTNVGMNSITKGSEHPMSRSRPQVPADDVKDQPKAACNIDPGQNLFCLDDRPCGLAKTSARAQLPFQDVKEGFGLGDLDSCDQHLLGLVHEPPGRQRLAPVAPLPPEDQELAEAFQGDFDGREEPPRLHGCEVRDDTRFSGPPDELSADIAGEEDDGHRPVGDDRPCGVDAVEPGELGLHENETRLEPLGSRNCLAPVLGGSEHEVAEPLELRLQAGGDEILWLDDEDPQSFRASAVNGHAVNGHTCESRALCGAGRQSDLSLKSKAGNH